MSKGTLDSSNSNVSFFLLLKNLLNLRADTDEKGTTELIKSNVEFQSANAWTLVFAIFIASVGLNVNSTAVIIGAMLISPLMGPIIGIGFSLGTYDFILLKKSARNLAAAVVISVVASTVYFLISPLSEIQSELLARTRPSFFDVLVAFFGGAAGIITISRKERGNAIAGVAIATALMPPLCTAGFGLATRNYGYFFGAMYLFVINSVFISISTFIFVRYLRFSKAAELHSTQEKYVNRWIGYVGMVVLIPSFFMAWYLQQESFFKSQANKYISQELNSDKSFTIDRDISYSIKDPRLKVTLIGDRLSESEIKILKEKGKDYSISEESIDIRQATFSESLEKKIGDKISADKAISDQLKVRLKKNESELEEIENLMSLSAKVTEESAEIFPKIINIVVTKRAKHTEFVNSTAPEAGRSYELNAMVGWVSNPSKLDVQKATGFLSKRLGVDAEHILHFKKL